MCNRLLLTKRPIGCIVCVIHPIGLFIRAERIENIVE